MNTQHIISIAKDYVNTVKKSGIIVERAYIFGSQIKGTARKDSDLDIGIISSSFGTDRHKERVKLIRLTHNFKDEIEPHPITLEEFTNPHNPFVKEVKKGLKII